ncbi:TPA: VENN motif pre-toxin domain-containing protein [Enterobacter bugandensis]|nr:VENN motif pre-toxin domain-containing protein [Enterobacter bugandensis]
MKDLSKLSEDQKQTIVTLASVSAGMAGGLAGGSTASAAAGAQGGKNAAENNATSNWGGLVPPATQQDASLAFDLGGKGVSPDKINKAIKDSHIGPSVGDTAKTHGDVKGQVAVGYVGGGYLEGVLSEDKFAINGGITKVFGWRADASAGLTFGPYPIKDFNPAYDYSGSISAGIFSIEGSVGRDGVGGAFRIGGGIGASIRQSENHNNLPEIDGAGSTELVSWPFKKD